MPQVRELPPQEVLAALLRYDPETGKLYWKERRGQFRYLGTFVDQKQAAAERKNAEVAHGFHPNHGREGSVA